MCVDIIKLKYIGFVCILNIFYFILYYIIDFGAEHEKTETLQEYVGSKLSPWNLDYSWSEEAKQLREIAVKSPWLIDDNFILSHFKTLRIVDKQVSLKNQEFYNAFN